MLIDWCWYVSTCGRDSGHMWPLWAKNPSCCCFSCGDQMTTRAMLRDRVCLVVFFVFCFYKIILHNWGTSIMPSWKTWRSSMSLLVWRIRSWLSCSQKLGQVTGYEQNIQFQWDLSHQFMRASLECSPKRMGTVSLYPDCVRSNPNHNQSPYLIYLLYIYLFTGILQYIDIYCTYLHIRTNHILISIHTGSG